MPWYIKETNNKYHEKALYGPFPKSELGERLNDAFADFMAEGLANIDAVYIPPKRAAKYYINPPEFWMEQLTIHSEE